MGMMLLLGLGGLLVACLAAYPLTSRPAAGAALVLASFLTETVLLRTPGIPLGIYLYPPDVVFALLLLAVVLRYALGMTVRNRTRILLLCIFLLYTVALARGFVRFGAKQAGVEGRTVFYFLSGIMYFSAFSLGARQRAKILNLWFGAAFTVSAICILRWMAVLGGLEMAATWQAYLGPGYRVVNAENANVAGMAFFASMLMNIRGVGPLWQRKLYTLFGPVVLLLQHRTVWLGMLAGLFWIGMQDRRFRRQAIAGLVTLAVLGAAAVLFLFGSQTQDLAGSLQNSASNDESFLWRFAGWYQLLFANPARNALNDLIGQPYGTGFLRWIGGMMVDTTPHNFYIELFLRIGIVGVVLWIWVYTAGIRRMRRVPPMLRQYAYPDARFWALVLFLQLVYSCTYAISYEQTILSGVALSGLGLRRPTVPPSEAQPL